MHNHNIPPRPRPPTTLILIVAGLALVTVIGVLAWLAYQFNQLDPALAAAIRSGLFVVPLALGTGLAIGYGAVSLIAFYNRKARLAIVQRDKEIALAAAQRELPEGVQTVSWHDSSRQLLPPPQEHEVIDVTPEPAKVPRFSELLDSGRVGTGRPLLLGYNAATGEAIEGSWSKLYSTGIGGSTGSGKSWLCAFLLAQSVASSSARLIIIDPHAGDPESLSERLAGLSAAFKCPVAQTPAQIESALKLAARELENRIAGSPTPHPVILVCDEWTSLLRGRMEDLLIKVALDYAEQGRKYGCFAMLAAQGWQAVAAGPVRDRLASHYTMRARGDQFRYQTGLRGSAPLDTLFLKPGEAYFLSVAGDLTKVVIPQMESRDLLRVGAMIDKVATVAGLPFGLIPATQGTTPAASVAGYRPATATATSTPQSATEAIRAATLFVAERKSPAEIVRELRGIGSKEGTRYQTALNEVLELIRQGMEVKQ